MIKIKGKIIRIIDPRTVIIDLGRQDGIVNSSIFSILAEPEPVIHPDTGEELGRIPVVKAKLKASQVYDKFTIATASWTYYSGLYRTSTTAIDRLLEVKRVDNELFVKSEDLEPWKAQTEIPVKKGDFVEVEINDLESDTQKVNEAKKGNDEKNEEADT